MERIHKSHLHEEKYKSRAKGILYWPRINIDLSQVTAGYFVCLEFRRGNIKETIIAHEVNSQPFIKVGANLFQFGGKDYLIAINYYLK